MAPSLGEAMGLRAILCLLVLYCHCFVSVTSGLDAVTTAAPCVDHNEKCPGWAATGECKINAKWMSENCAVSCKRCVPPSRVVSDKGKDVVNGEIKKPTESPVSTTTQPAVDQSGVRPTGIPSTAKAPVLQSARLNDSATINANKSPGVSGEIEAVGERKSAVGDTNSLHTAVEGSQGGTGEDHATPGVVAEGSKVPTGVAGAVGPPGTAGHPSPSTSDAGSNHRAESIPQSPGAVGSPGSIAMIPHNPGVIGSEGPAEKIPRIPGAMGSNNSPEIGFKSPGAMPSNIHGEIGSNSPGAMPSNNPPDIGSEKSGESDPNNVVEIGSKRPGEISSESPVSVDHGSPAADTVPRGPSAIGVDGNAGVVPQGDRSMLNNGLQERARTGALLSGAARLIGNGLPGADAAHSNEHPGTRPQERADGPVEGVLRIDSNRGGSTGSGRPGANRDQAIDTTSTTTTTTTVEPTTTTTTRSTESSIDHAVPFLSDDDDDDDEFKERHLPNAPLQPMGTVPEGAKAAPCVDHDMKMCPRWAATGECEINAKWMSENCAVSCKRCVPPSRVVSDKGKDVVNGEIKKPTESPVSTTTQPAVDQSGVRPTGIPSTAKAPVLQSARLNDSATINANKSPGVSGEIEAVGERKSAVGDTNSLHTAVEGSQGGTGEDHATPGVVAEGSKVPTGVAGAVGPPGTAGHPSPSTSDAGSNHRAESIPQSPGAVGSPGSIAMIPHNPGVIGSEGPAEKIPRIPGAMGSNNSPEIGFKSPGAMPSNIHGEIGSNSPGAMPSNNPPDIGSEKSGESDPNNVVEIGSKRPGEISSESPVSVDHGSPAADTVPRGPSAIGVDGNAGVVPQGDRSMLNNGLQERARTGALLSGAARLIGNGLPGADAAHSNEHPGTRPQERADGPVEGVLRIDSNRGGSTGSGRPGANRDQAIDTTSTTTTTTTVEPTTTTTTRSTESSIDHAVPFLSDDDDDDDEFKERHLPNAPLQPMGTVPEGAKGGAVARPASKGNDVPTKSSHFMAYFVTMGVIVIILYLVYHNKQKLFAYVLEGKDPRPGRSTKYRKLAVNVEEAMPSLDKAPSKDYVY